MIENFKRGEEMNEWKLKELLPDLEIKTTYIENAFKCEAVDKYESRKRDENLRKVVKSLIERIETDMVFIRAGEMDFDDCDGTKEDIKLIEQITGLKYSEVTK